MSNYAWVTLTTNDTYSLGALVLAHSLKRAGTAYQLVVLITPGVSECMRQRLKEVYDIVQEVNVMDSQDAANLALLARPELGVTFTKLHCWRLVQFEKCVFLDSDALVLKNCDELFEREELSAAPDVSWPDCFNSGVFVYRPSLETFDKLTKFAVEYGSFDGGDQGLLNQYFADWAYVDIHKHLPFVYNVTAYASYCYLPAFKHFKDKIKILHFAGKMKPWLMHYNAQNKAPSVPSQYTHAADLIQLWWNIFFDNVHQRLNRSMAGLAGALSQLRLGEQRTDEQEAYDLLMRRQAWEAGQMDYTGLDSFDNIWKKIQETLQSKPEDGIAMLTSADIQDGKTEYDAKTGATTKYKKIDGGYEMITTMPQPNGTVKTQVRTFWDPKPVSEEDMKREQANRKVVQQRMNKEIRIDERTTMLTRAIEGGYEEVYTTVNEDGTISTKTKTFFDSVPAGTPFPGQGQYQPQSQQPQQLGKDNSQAQYIETRNLVQNVNKNQQIQHNIQQENVHHNVQQKVQQNVKQNVQQTKIQHQSTIEESHRFTENIEITENSRTVRKNSLQEQSTKSITTSNMSDGNKDTKKKVKKQKSSAPPPPPDFLQNDTTTVSSKRVPGGTEYTYTTQLESGKKITTSKTVYEEEETELTEEEIKQYKKALKDAEKHKNVTTTKKLKSDSGTKKVVPSENPGDVTTVETIKIDGGTEYHYTTVTAEGIVKKAVKTVYDPVACNDPDDTEEEEIVEEYEEEIIEPGEKSIQTIETIKKLPQKFEEEVTITHEKKEKKIKKSMMKKRKSEIANKILCCIKICYCVKKI
uniref:glycogenin glucosyltransferase n=1 Tax=Glossina morsitans morsitans TaxID=37546 RepID=A0A1B0GCA5_GLOMM